MKLSIEEILEIPENKRNSIESLFVSLWKSDEDNGLAVLNASFEYLESSARIAALEADKAKLIEALVKAESALTYANWDGEFDDTHTSQDVINARDEARRVLAEVTK